MVRISLRCVGADKGKVASLPDSFDALLELATRKLQLSSPVLRVFNAAGDEFEADDLVLVHSCAQRNHKGGSYKDSAWHTYALLVSCKRCSCAYGCAGSN